MARERHEQADDPLMYPTNIPMQTNATTGALISDFLATNAPNIQSVLEKVHERISLSTGLCCVAYCMFNSTFELLYGVCMKRHTISDSFRISFTRFRVSA